MAMRRKGFTLIELVVVVAVVTILTGASVPHVGRYIARRQLEASGFALVQDLKRVQMDAVFTRRDRKVQFVPGSDWYRFETEVGSLVLPPRLDGLCKRQLGGSVGFQGVRQVCAVVGALWRRIDQRLAAFRCRLTHLE